jgi:hypothetical protein
MSSLHYACEKCEYSTMNRKDYSKHLTTRKHLLAVDGLTINRLVCPYCAKTYKHQSSMCKHKKICDKKGDTDDLIEMLKTQNQIQKDYIDLLSKQKEDQLKELTSMFMKLVDENKEMIKMATKMPANVVNNTINNKISINVFLNEYCKNAMTLRDFIESIRITMEDLFRTNNLGYSAGISDIIIRSLSELGSNERPIHCSDNKRLQFYIKEENRWNKDNGDKMNTAITKIAHKHILKMKEWEKEHPNWLNNDQESEQYMKMLHNLMGGENEEEQGKNAREIMKKIGNVVLIKHAINSIMQNDDDLQEGEA